jgi:hypothetical protein
VFHFSVSVFCFMAYLVTNGMVWSHEFHVT